MRPGEYLNSGHGPRGNQREGQTTGLRRGGERGNQGGLDRHGGIRHWGGQRPVLRDGFSGLSQLIGTGRRPFTRSLSLLTSHQRKKPPQHKEIDKDTSSCHDTPLLPLPQYLEGGFKTTPWWFCRIPTSCEIQGRSYFRISCAVLSGPRSEGRLTAVGESGNPRPQTPFAEGEFAKRQKSAVLQTITPPLDRGGVITVIHLRNTFGWKRSA